MPLKIHAKSELPELVNEESNMRVLTVDETQVVGGGDFEHFAGSGGGGSGTIVGVPGGPGGRSRG